MNILKKTRKQKGMSLIVAAKLVEMPIILYWYYEKNQRYLTTEMVEIILNKMKNRS